MTTSHLIIGKVDIQNDIAVLWSPEVNNAPQTGLESIKQAFVVDPTTTYRVIGYPFDLFRQKQMVDVRILERTELGNLLPNNAIPTIAERDSPAIDAKVFSIQAHLVPGHSGAPLLNQNDQVVGIGNGGLDLGRVEMGWAIPWDEIDLKPVSIKVSQNVSWTDFRRLIELQKSESGLVFSYDTPELSMPSPISTPFVLATPTLTKNDANCTFWFQIVDSDLEPIRGEHIKLIYQLESIENFSDSEGTYRGSIPCEQQNPLITVEVTAQGFIKADRIINLGVERFRIQLYPLATETPTITLTPTPSQTATDTPTPSVKVRSFVEAIPKLRIRSAPGVNNEVVKQVIVPELFVVVDGPIKVDDYDWWQLSELNGKIIGWAAYVEDEGDVSLTVSDYRTATPTPLNSQDISTEPTPIPTKAVIEIISPHNGDSINGKSEVWWRYDKPLAPGQGFDLILWYPKEPRHKGITDAREIEKNLIKHGNGQYSVAVNFSGAPLVEQFCDASYLLYVIVVQLEPYKRIGPQSDFVDIRSRPLSVAGCK